MSAGTSSVCVAGPSTRHHVVTLSVRFVATAVAAAILWTASHTAPDSSAAANAHATPAIVASGS